MDFLIKHTLAIHIGIPVNIYIFMEKRILIYIQFPFYSEIFLYGHILIKDRITLKSGVPAKIRIIFYIDFPKLAFPVYRKRTINFYIFIKSSRTLENRRGCTIHNQFAFHDHVLVKHGVPNRFKRTIHLGIAGRFQRIQRRITIHSQTILNIRITGNR